MPRHPPLGHNPAHFLTTSSASPHVDDNSHGRRWMPFVETQEDEAAADFIARRCERMQNGHMHDC